MNHYYEENAKQYIESTISCDMDLLYSFFEEHLPKHGTILDLGFGSGRDSLYFRKKGYEVYGVDPTISFCQHLKDLGFVYVYPLKAQDMDFHNQFDGIWACASLLHVPSRELNMVFQKCSEALKESGILYVSFKQGKFEGERDRRHYLDLTKEELEKYLEGTSLMMKEVLITDDVRKDNPTKWLNVILTKTAE